MDSDAHLSICRATTWQEIELTLRAATLPKGCWCHRFGLAPNVQECISKIEDLLSKLIKLKNRKTCLNQLSKKKIYLNLLGEC